jgi:hypothetical protein
MLVNLRIAQGRIMLEFDSEVAFKFVNFFSTVTLLCEL